MLLQKLHGTVSDVIGRSFNFMRSTGTLVELVETKIL